MKNSREAGKRGEREAAKYLASLGFGEYGADTRRGQQHRGGRDSPDVICEALSAVHIEVKVGSPAYIDLGPRLVAAMEQAINDAARAGKFPMVLWRNPRRLWRLSYYDNWDRLVTVFGDPNIRETLAQYAVRQGEARP